MFSSIFGFEWRFRRRSLMFKIFCALFFALTVLLVAWEDVNMPAAGGKIARNSPHAISVFFIIISQLGMFVAAAFVAGCVQRDRDYKADSLFYSMPISRHGYLAGRFFGSLLPACLVAVAAALAHALASAAPWLPAEKIVAFTAVPYLTALAYFAIPNFFIMGALAFAVSTLTRRLLWGYVALILVLLFNGVSQSFLTDLDNQVIAAFADPFGATAWSHATRYWTIAEKNSQVLLADGLMLGNRALWIAVAAGLLALTHARVRLAVGDDGKRARKPAAPEPTVTAHSSVAVPSATRSFGFAAHLAQLRVQLVGEVRWVIKKIGFVILVAFGMVNVAFLANALSRQLFGTPVFPVTRLMLEASANGFSVFMLAIITVYSGALVWRERESKIHEIYDALPIPDWIPLVSKLTALLCAVLLLLFGSMLASLGYQLANGFMTVELGLFVKGLLLVEFPGWIEVAVLGFAIQVLVNHKYLGFGVMTAYFLALIILPQVGVEHNLVLYGQTPGSPYSDMNGYGHFATPLLWFHLYWLAAAAILGLAANLFWVRGTDDSLRLRAREARRRVNRLNTTALVAAAAVFFATGGYIFYNTNVLNTFKTSDQRNEERAEFERKYKQYEDVPQPRVTAVKLDVDIYPYERKYRGDMTLVNKTGRADRSAPRGPRSRWPGWRS
ncbi:MAG: ABC transporter permease subunit [Nannocystaceae bacterium]